MWRRDRSHMSPFLRDKGFKGENCEGWLILRLLNYKLMKTILFFLPMRWKRKGGCKPINAQSGIVPWSGIFKNKCYDPTKFAQISYGGAFAAGCMKVYSPSPAVHISRSSSETVLPNRVPSSTATTSPTISRRRLAVSPIPFPPEVQNGTIFLPLNRMYPSACPQRWTPEHTR